MGADRPGGREEEGGPVARRLFVLYPLPYLPGAQRGQLVHDRVGPHLAHRGEQVLAVHHVGHHGLSAGVAQPLSVGLAAGDADDLVAGGDELAGERCTDGARRRRAGLSWLHPLPVSDRVASVVRFRWFCARFIPASFPDSGRIPVGWVGLSRTAGE